jgi:arabinose-5-phosphate isomerase
VDIFAEFRRVIDIEIEALESVRDRLTEQAVQAVEMIADCKGQVVVTGIGKSGLIATKIAATLRSTGTPAVFLHAAEALHGDLGIVRAGDIILAIGKSGETTELTALLRVLRNNGIRIIAITANPESSMAGLADCVLELRVPREACPLDLTPTSSTTAALVVGDAIAVTLMKLKNISSDDFARHHPGGQIGKRLLLTIEDVMRKDAQNPIVSVESSVKEMLARITEFRVGAISVVGKNGKLLGLVTDYDIRKSLESGQDLLQMKISEIMNPSPAFLYSDAKAIDALELMRARNKPTAVMPILNRDETVVGMVHLHDLISAGL